MKTDADKFRERKKIATPAYEQDRELAVRVVEGDKEALVRLVDRHIGPIYKYLSRRVGPGNEALVGEVVEAAFEEMFRNLQPYARGSTSLHMRLKLFRLANKYLAKRRRRLAIAPTSDREEESDELITLRRELRKLPMRHQSAFALALYEEMPPEEI